MKQLNKYRDFAIVKFLLGKKMIIGGAKARVAGENNAEDVAAYPTEVKGMIMSDPLNDEVNAGEPITIKVANATGIEVGAVIEFGQSAGQYALSKPVATVYGDYGNQLSIKAQAIVKRSKDAGAQ